jgi:predicted RNA-binding protein (virulence factor B family)
MIEAGRYHTLEAVKKVDFGWYLDGGNGLEILLPTRFVPDDLQLGDRIKVFIYHDGESRLIATTQRPLAAVGDIAALKVVSQNHQGAFLEWGIMKDLFLPLSQQSSRIYDGQKYLVYVYIDELTGRTTATERFGRMLLNHTNELAVGEAVDILIWAETDLGYRAIVDGLYTGLLYHSDILERLEPGQRIQGFVHAVRPDGKLDLKPGIRGHNRVKQNTDILLEKLREAGGYLPYNDKTPPEVIADVFGMSKKVFKMAVGALYKQQQIVLTQTGIKQVS